MTRFEANLEAALDKFFSDGNKTKAFAISIGEVVKKDFKQIFEIYEEKISTLEAENSALKKQIDNVEQYNKRKTLRIIGIKETENENVLEIVEDIIKSKMKLNISQNSIDECYRIQNKKDVNKPGGQQTEKTVAIVVKFNTYEDRKMVYANKSRLKNFKIKIYEDLTKSKLLLMNKAIVKYGWKNVWTLDGKIKVKTELGIKLITDESDI